MIAIDTEKFFAAYRPEFGKLNQGQVDGLVALIKAINADDEMTDARWVAYMLATVKHETADTYQPIEEYGKGKGKKYGQPAPPTLNVFYGRGYVQLTWAGNYRTMGKILGVDLERDPSLALIPGVAYKIMSYGMRHGTFTGARLGLYINDNVCAYHDARKIINGLDCANLIAVLAVKFEKILKESQV